MANDTTVEVRVLALTDSGRFVEHPETDCPPYLELDATLSFQTLDGTFNEQVAGKVRRSDGKLRFSGELPLDSLQGDYDTDPLSGWYRNPRFRFTTGLLPLKGQLSMSGDDPDSDPDTLVTSASVAEWGYSP